MNLENLARLIFTAGLIMPTVSPLELIWIVYGAYTNFRAWRAYDDAQGDVDVSLGPPPLTLLQQEQASGHRAAIRWLWVAAAALEGIGIAAAFTPPPTEQRTITPGAIAGAPLAILAFVAMSLTVETIVRSRERWRKLYRARRARTIP